MVNWKKINDKKREKEENRKLKDPLDALKNLGLGAKEKLADAMISRMNVIERRQGLEKFKSLHKGEANYHSLVVYMIKKMDLVKEEGEDFLKEVEADQSIQIGKDMEQGKYKSLEGALLDLQTYLIAVREDLYAPKK